MSLFSRKKRPDRDAVDQLYRKITAQARDPVFYTLFGVPDTAEGRFEMLVLHVFAVTRRLVRGTDTDPDYARVLAEAFVVDLDANLREMGVGDLSVGRKVKRLFAAYGARVAAYDTALSAPVSPSGGDPLAAALSRNIFGAEDPDGASQRMARYLRRVLAALARASAEAVRQSSFVFPSPAEVRERNRP